MDRDTNTPTPAVQKDESSRDRILSEAVREFARYGFEGARVDRIASAAGVNKAMIYYYFASKEKLYDQILMSFFEEMRSAIAPELDSSASLERILSVMAQMYARLFTRRPELPSLFLRELAKGDSGKIGVVAEFLSQWGIRDRLFEVWGEGVRRGEIRPLDPRQALISFITMNVGYYLMSPLVDRLHQIDNRAAFIESRIPAVVDLFLHGVMAGKEQ